MQVIKMIVCIDHISYGQSIEHMGCRVIHILLEKKMGATNHRTEIHIYAKLGKLEPYMPPSAARARREKRWEGEEAMTHHASDVPLRMGGG